MSKLTIVGLVMLVFSLIVRLAQTHYMPGIMERARNGGPIDSMLVPLGIAIFVSYLLFPLGFILCVVGLLSKRTDKSDSSTK